MPKFWIFRKGTMEWIQWTMITWLLIPVLICPPIKGIKSKSSGRSSNGDTDESTSDPYHPESSLFPSQRPLLNYRTRSGLGIRYGEPYSTHQEDPPPIISSNYRKNPVTYNNPLISKSYSSPSDYSSSENPHKTHQLAPSQKTDYQIYTQQHQQPNYDEYEESDERIPDKSTTTTEIQIEASTSRIPVIPHSLRRKFAYQIGTTSEPTTIEPSKPKTSKNRRRKIKRPPKIKATTTKVFDDDLGNENKTSSSSSSSSGDKNLALEIGSNDGKYALINNFFESEPNKKPPGIMSYLTSDDFSTDNQETLGNLDENDIWLSEGHLLVLRGGDFDSTSKVSWKPIDNYVRDRSKPPLRIPLDTNNPPPFPVFLNKSGPPVFLGPIPPYALPYPPPGYNGNETFDPSRFPPPGMIPLYPNGTVPEFFGPPPPGYGNYTGILPPPPGFFPGTGPQGGGVNGGRPGGLYGGGPPNNDGYGYGGVNNGQPRPVTQNGKPPGAFPGGFNGTRLPHPPPPFYPFGPPPPGFNPNFTGPPGNGGPGGPGGPFPFLPPLVLNPNDNETDDPSIFLPPPYDFDYYEDNSTHVPPGPFAPGLVVPPPQEFYTVYNRTSQSPPTSYFTTTPSPSTISNKVDYRPQRPNAKKPKFPMTNPPDDSEEEGLAHPPSTSPLPIIPISFPNSSKKRKRPPNGKTGKSYKYSSEDFSGERPNYPIQIVTSPRATTTTIPTTTPKPLNYVYVRGQLKTLAEIAAEEAAEEGYNDGPPTPRPPFDELGYPTRGELSDEEEVDNENNSGGYGNYQEQQPSPSPSPPPKNSYHNTPKYNPKNYEVEPYRKNIRVQQETEQEQQHPKNPNHHNSGDVYQGNSIGKIRQRGRGSSGTTGNRIRLTPSSSPAIPTILVPLNNKNNNNNNEQGQILYYPSNFQHATNNNQNQNEQGNNNNQHDHNVLGIVPTIYTPHHHHHQIVTLADNNIHPTTGGSNNGNHNERIPQNYQPTNQPIYNNVLLNHQIHPTQQAYHQQQQEQQGFRPLFNQPQHQQYHLNPYNNQQIHHQASPQSQRGGSRRIIFPDQINNNHIHQQQPSPLPLIYSTPSGPLASPSPQGYYSPLSQFRQPIPTSGQFVPNAFYPGTAGGGEAQAGYPGSYRNQAQYFQPNPQQQQYFQQYQQQPQHQQTPQNLNEYAIQQQQLQQAQQQQQHQQQEQIPLHRDILVNYREPLPQYNTESESVTTRSIPIQKAGPSSSGIYGTSEPAAEGLTQPNLPPASFYSFQRGGPGGFSYKIRL